MAPDVGIILAWFPSPVPFQADDGVVTPDHEHLGMANVERPAVGNIETNRPKRTGLERFHQLIASHGVFPGT
jgi:hypothetical protein